MLRSSKTNMHIFIFLVPCSVTAWIKTIYVVPFNSLPVSREVFSSLCPSHCQSETEHAGIMFPNLTALFRATLILLAVQDDACEKKGKNHSERRVNNQQTHASLILLKHSLDLLSSLCWWDTIIQKVRRPWRCDCQWS